MSEQEQSASGSPVFRYDHVQPKEFTPAIGDEETIERVTQHIETHVGKIESVFHEIVSDLVHLDVHWVKPSNQLPFHVLITSGMSDLPMKIPAEYEANPYAELCILLPADWPMGTAYNQSMEEAFKDENNYWPIRWLKTIARFPHEYDTWLGYGHTIPNGEEAAPFSDSTKLGCMLLLPSVSLSEDFFSLKVNDEKVIDFYCLCPLYKSEMDFKLKKGVDALLDKFNKYGIRDIVDIGRKNTCAKKGLFGLW
jgi:hypothetical protein